MDIGISVLMPLYNGIEFLEESLQSVVQQTHKKWEVIIGINGHNKDSEIERMANHIASKYYIANIYDIRIIHYDTKGKAHTLNKMIEDIKYDYVALLDVDDVWFSNKLEKQIPFLSSYDVVGTQCMYFGNMNGCPSIPFGDISSYDFFILNPVVNSSVIIHKDNANWNDEFADDYDMWLRLRYERKKFYNISDVLCKHRVYPQSAFNSKPGDWVENLRKKWLKVYDDNGLLPK